MSKAIRNLIIFTVVAVACGFVGIALDRLQPPQDTMQGLGALVWLTAPLATILLLRTFGGDGWKDFGLGLNLKTGWRWYLAALLIIPLVTLVTLGVASVFGVVTFGGSATQGFGAFLSAFGVGLTTVMVKNIFEEFTWRGYLTPRFEAIKLHPYVNALLTGFIWAGWHVPYYLYFLNRETFVERTSLGVWEFILVMFVVFPLIALTFGELRLLSKSVWPGWLMHNIANAVSLALISGNFIGLSRNFAGAIFSPGTEGVFISLLMSLVGVALYQVRKNQAAILPRTQTGMLAFLRSTQK